MTREELLIFLSDNLGLCGCSDGDRVVEFLRELLEAGEMRDDGHDAEASALLDSIMPEGDCLERNLPVYWITAAGLTEHGMSLDSYGLSELGDLLLSALREHGTGDELWVSDMAPFSPEVWN